MTDVLGQPFTTGTVSVGEQRDHQREQSDREGDERDRIGEQRDQLADSRDDAADARDSSAEERDHAADEQDVTANERDRAAQKAETTPGGLREAGTIERAARARSEAASDRRRASSDRRAGAQERAQGEHDRTTALADRVRGATERAHAGVDRDSAQSDRTASTRELEHAGIDALTGMYLRRTGLFELNRQIARARRTRQTLVVVFVDVDHLKTFNDTHGHAAGDRMLVIVATTLGSNLRPYDLIIRYGGDEFVCVIVGLSAKDAARRLNLVNAALAEGPARLSVTFGLAELQPDDSPEDLVARADAALYRQRHQQRGRTVPQAWECGGLVVDESTRTVCSAGSSVSVTDDEFNLLSVLIRNHPRVVPEAQLLGQAWGQPVARHVLEAHVTSLRRKLEVYGSRQIHSIPGSGYVLRPGQTAAVPTG